MEHGCISLSDAAVAWGSSMLRDFAAKQQLVDRTHMFCDRVSARDRTELRALSDACAALGDGEIDLEALQTLLVRTPASGDAALMFRAAVGRRSQAVAGMALAIAYLPFPVVDAFAACVGGTPNLRRVAGMVDPDRRLVPRTRLFLADRLMRDPSVHGLVAATAAAAALLANAPDWQPGRIPAARLRRLGRFADALPGRQAGFGAALRSCRDGNWRYAGHLARGMTISGEHQSDDAALADLLAVTLLPSCDTLEAAARLLARAAGDQPERAAVSGNRTLRMARNSASRASAAGEPKSGIRAISSSDAAPSR